MNTDDIRIDINGPVKPEEVLAVREEVNGDTELWSRCLRDSFCIVTARDTTDDRLLGIGFLAGNSRHCQIVDLGVHPSARERGIGGRIVSELVSHAKVNKVRYLGLTYDTKSPWLKEFYERHGFRSIDFAMWESQSLLD